MNTLKNILKMINKINLAELLVCSEKKNPMAKDAKYQETSQFYQMNVSLKTSAKSLK